MYLHWISHLPVPTPCPSCCLSCSLRIAFLLVCWLCLHVFTEPFIALRRYWPWTKRLSQSYLDEEPKNDVLALGFNSEANLFSARYSRGLHTAPHTAIALEPDNILASSPQGYFDSHFDLILRGQYSPMTTVSRPSLGYRCLSDR